MQTHFRTKLCYLSSKIGMGGGGEGEGRGVEKPVCTAVVWHSMHRTEKTACTVFAADSIDFFL